VNYIEPELIYIHFFFVDIVGLSNPLNSTKNQLKKLDILHESVKKCKTFQETPREDMIHYPSGDGLALGFFRGPHQPYKLGIELQEQVAASNKGRMPSEIVEIRIGLNSGHVFYVKNVFDQKGMWGPGIIIARRVMDFGDSGHILMTGKMAEELSEISDDYKKNIHKIEDLIIKHGKPLSVYSVYGKNFGNSSVPQKAREQGIRSEFVGTNKQTLYPKIINEITIIDPKTMLTRHKRIYEIVNVGKEPIKNVIHGIGTDVKINSLDELKVKVYDEQNKEMEIEFLTKNYPYQKEFTTKFNQPILNSDSNRSYTLEYEIEEPERIFENSFQVNCTQFELVFIYPENSGISKPSIFEVNPETETVTPSEIKALSQNQDHNISLKWTFENISKGSTLRIKW